MQFKKFTASKWAFGKDIMPNILQEDNVCFYDPKLDEALLSGNIEQKEAVVRVLIFLACCHTIIIDHKKGRYNSSSPDELALVNAAKQFGYEFKDRDSDDNIVILDKTNNTELKYQLLNICEFTSTRKRQSCIFRDPNGRIVLMCKGADSVIAERLNQASMNSDVFTTTTKFVDNFAEEGLRTLFLAERYIDEQTYAIWNEESKAAKLEINNREEKVAAVDEKIEIELELVGSTAIEDKLQDEVATTI
jgi:magnesium-transporting ATPase (P-type)